MTRITVETESQIDSVGNRLIDFDFFTYLISINYLIVSGERSKVKKISLDNYQKKNFKYHDKSHLLLVQFIPVIFFLIFKYNNIM